MNKADAILHLFPNAKPIVDFIVKDESNGEDPYISFWNVKDTEGADIPQPTAAELQAAWDEMNAPDVLLAKAKEAKIQELNGACNAAILAGFTSSALGTPHSYDFDYEAQTNLGGMLNAITAGILPAESLIDWKTIDSGMQPHTVVQFKQLYADGLTHKQINIASYWTKKEQALAAATEADVAAIVW